MTRHLRQKQLLFSAVFIISIALSLFRVFIIMHNMEDIPTVDNTNYYLVDNDNTKYFAILTAVAVIVFFIISLFLNRIINNELAFGESSIIFTSSLSGFLLLGCVSYYFLYFKSLPIKLTIFETFIVIFAILSSVYFLANASKKAESGNKLIAWLSLAPITFYALRLLNDFIRQSTSPDASSTPYLLLSIIAFLLFFLSEGKFLSGTGSVRLYMFFGFCAILFSLIYSLPVLVLTSFWVLPGNYGILFSAADLTLALYVSAKICNLKCRECEKTELSGIKDKA
ncbi:MAG: hypothetical protein PHD46_01555 [Eubacteriales bacterium]|nr:hypothetical protein [Eubacteriales bacterium]MDD4421702.1 hypothetical protein [Eubacteriales bacterium]